MNEDSKTPIRNLVSEQKPISVKEAKDLANKSIKRLVQEIIVQIDSASN